jgi:hypothetical protein
MTRNSNTNNPISKKDAEMNFAIESKAVMLNLKDHIDHEMTVTEKYLLENITDGAIRECVDLRCKTCGDILTIESEPVAHNLCTHWEWLVSDEEKERIHKEYGKSSDGVEWLE